jgi:hypothetical protein
MILRVTFEELSAISAGAGRALDAFERGGVAAPPDVMPDIEALIGRLDGDLDIETLAEQQSVERAVQYLLNDARMRTDEFILEQHPAAEAAVASYFEYAHLLAVADRLGRLGTEMRAIIELITGQPPTPETAAGFAFSD